MIRFLLLSFLVCAYPVRAEFSREYLDQQPLEVSTANGMSIAYRSLGVPGQPTIIMIMGLGASHVVWGDAIAQGLQSNGFRVILLDNRDTGASTRFDDWGQPTLWWQVLKFQVGLPVDAPYTLSDMAADTIALMDVLELQDAHIVGASMGGMIAQIIAARYPERTRSLVSIMSTTGAPHLPPPSTEASKLLLGTATDSDEAAERRAAMVLRGFYPEVMGRQMMAVFESGDRSKEVATISRPTLVIHGGQDTLIPPPHGEYTAEMIKGSELVVFNGMGHDLPEEILPEMLTKMTQHMQGVDRARIPPLSVK